MRDGTDQGKSAGRDASLAAKRRRQLQSWMNGCTQDCTEFSYTAGSGQYCYGLEKTPYDSYTDPFTGQTTTVLGPPTYSQECWPTEYANYSCLQQCVSEYNSGLEACISEWCTQL